MSRSTEFTPDSTKDGALPPLEVTKVWAFKQVIEKVEEVLGEEAQNFLGMGRNDFIASHVVKKGGGHPTARAIQKTLAKCQNPSWHPGKGLDASTGRPPVYSDHVKSKVAEVAMILKRKNIAPTPRRVRARLPNLTINPTTGARMTDKTMHGIYSTRCFDEDEDDLWQYLTCVSQDILPSELLPRRVACARHIKRFLTSTTWYSHVGFDPCYSLLAKTIAKLEEQQIKAMGKDKWMSKASARTGNNPRAPSTTMTQGGQSIRVDWTPVFARGKLRIVVIDPEKARVDPLYPTKLTDATNLGKFIRTMLPKVLEEMKEEHAWPNLPRTLVHDKASYMVTHVHDRLSGPFARALDDVGLTSWIGDNHGTTSWLAPKWGDVYLHETVISHIRRLLDTDFAYTSLGETPAHFATRMKKVERFMNSAAFAKRDGGRGLMGLAKELQGRCDLAIKRKGERIPK
jgi:hypothetical protein